MSPLNTDPPSFKTFTTPRNAHRASFKSLSELLGEGKGYETAKVKTSPRLIANHAKISEEIDEAEVIIKKAA